MTELERLHETKVNELSQIYQRESRGENLRMRRKELEQETDVLWALIEGEMRKRYQR